MEADTAFLLAGRGPLFEVPALAVSTFYLFTSYNKLPFIEIGQHKREAAGTESFGDQNRTCPQHFVQGMGAQGADGGLYVERQAGRAASEQCQALLQHEDEESGLKLVELLDTCQHPAHPTLTCIYECGVGLLLATRRTILHRSNHVGLTGRYFCFT